MGDPASLFAELTRLHQEAMPGPWIVSLGDYGGGVCGPDASQGVIAETCQGIHERPYRHADVRHDATTRLIVALHNAWPQIAQLVEAAKVSAELAPRVPDGNKFGHPWTIPNPVIEPLAALVEPTDG